MGKQAVLETRGGGGGEGEGLPGRAVGRFVSSAPHGRCSDNVILTLLPLPLLAVGEGGGEDRGGMEARRITERAET